MSNLRILMDQPHVSGPSGAAHSHLFGPGEAVTGKVVVRLPDDVNVEAVRVRFGAKCKVSISRGKNTYRYSRIIFRFENCVFKGPFKLRADTYEWPFAFTFPEACVIHTEREFNNDGPGAFLSGPQPLPPSCRVDEFHGEGRVTYKISAEIQRGLLGSHWIEEQHLNFSPSRTDAQPQASPKIARYLQTFVRDYRLTDAGEPRALSKRESFKNTFHSNTMTKTHKFSISGEAPTVMVIGRPCAITITVAADDTDDIIPEIRIRSSVPRLKAHTMVRVPGMIFDHNKNMSQDIPLNSALNLDAVLYINTPRKLTGSFPTHAFAPPTFSSFALIRTYSMKLEVTISCLGENFRATLHWPHVILLPANMGLGVEEAITSIENGPVELGANREIDANGIPVEPAPAYTQDLPPYQEQQALAPKS